MHAHDNTNQITMDDLHPEKNKRGWDEFRFSPWAVERAVDIARTYTANPHHLEAVRRLIAPADDVPVAKLVADVEAFRRFLIPDLRLHDLLLELEANLLMHLDLPRLAPVAREALRRLNRASPLSMNSTAHEFGQSMETPGWIMHVLTGDDMIDPVDLMQHSDDEMDREFFEGLAGKFEVFFGRRGLSLGQAEESPFWTTDPVLAEAASWYPTGDGEPRLFSGTAHLLDVGTVFAEGCQVVVNPRNVQEVSPSI